jgi:hypothetical protein
VEIFRKEEFLRSLKATGQGVIGDNQKLSEGAQSDEQRWNILRRTIESLVSSAAYYNWGPSPALEVHDSDYAPYFLLGLSRSQAPKNEFSGGGFLYFSSFDPAVHLPAGFVLSLSVLDLLPRFFEWVRDAENLVALERDIAFLPDPLQIIDDAVTPQLTGSRRGISPLDALVTITQFLRDRQPRSYPNPVHQEIYRDSIVRLEKIVQVIDELHFDEIDGTGDHAHLLQALREIREYAQLEHGSSFISTRMTRSLRIGLMQLLFESSSMFEPHLIAQLLAGEDIIAELLRISSRSSLPLIKRDIELSQVITESAIRSFYNVFETNMVEVLEDYHQQASMEPSHRSVYKNTLANYCLLILSAPQIHENRSLKRKVWQLCEGSSVPSIFPDESLGSKAISFADWQQPLDQRLCRFRDHYRREKIFQDHLRTVSF